MSFSTPYEWVASHFNLQSVGWTAGIYFLYRAIKFVVIAVSAAIRGRDRVLTAEGTLTLIATNHLPHLQVELEKINTVLDKIAEQQDRNNSLFERLLQKMDEGSILA